MIQCSGLLGCGTLSLGGCIPTFQKSKFLWDILGPIPPPPPHGATQPIVGVYFTASSRTRLLAHTQRRATVDRTPLNE
jgi:hypothetical protein